LYLAEVPTIPSIRARPGRVRYPVIVIRRAAPVSLLLFLTACSQPPVKPLGDSPQWLAAQKKAQFHDSAANMGRARAEDIERYLQENPDDLVSHQRLLIFYTENGTRFYDGPVADAALRKHEAWMKAHHPDDELLRATQQPQPVEDKALDLYDQGDTDGAQKLAQQTPQDFQSNMILGLVAMRKGDRKAAVTYLQKAGNGANFDQPVTYRLLSWLLKDGERAPVIEFLQRFGQTESADLIRKGLKPAWYPAEKTQ
jgi:hypothetical protein